MISTMTRVRLVAVVVLVGAGFACTSRSTPASTAEPDGGGKIALDAPVCAKWPDAAVTLDGGVGCAPAARAGTCGGPGSADASCVNNCNADEYALFCSPWDAGPAAGIECRPVGVEYPQPVFCCRCIE